MIGQAWTFWEADVNIPMAGAAGKGTEAGAAEKAVVICKATDASYNSQPDSVKVMACLRVCKGGRERNKIESVNFILYYIY